MKFFFPGSNKLPALDEIEGNDQEMTEEEWTRRVAELNKHQVEHDGSMTLFSVLMCLKRKQMPDLFPSF